MVPFPFTGNPRSSGLKTLSLCVTFYIQRCQSFHFKQVYVIWNLNIYTSVPKHVWRMQFKPILIPVYIRAWGVPLQFSWRSLVEALRVLHPRALVGDISRDGRHFSDCCFIPVITLSLLQSLPLFLPPQPHQRRQRGFLLDILFPKFHGLHGVGSCRIFLNFLWPCSRLWALHYWTLSLCKYLQAEEEYI